MSVWPVPSAFMTEISESHLEGESDGWRVCRELKSLENDNEAVVLILVGGIL